jgi:hypothetical protein
LVGGISDHNLGNAGASVVVGAHGKTVSTCWHECQIIAFAEG